MLCAGHSPQEVNHKMIRQSCWLPDHYSGPKTAHFQVCVDANPNQEVDVSLKWNYVSLWEYASSCSWEGSMRSSQLLHIVHAEIYVLCSYIFQPNDETVSCIRYMLPNNFRILLCRLNARVCYWSGVHLFVMIYTLLMFTQARMDFHTQSHTELKGRCKVTFITKIGWSMIKAERDTRRFSPSPELISVFYIQREILQIFSDIHSTKLHQVK